MTENVRGEDRLLADLIDIWKHVLALDTADAECDFVECDGTSMNAVRITSTINELIGQRVSPGVIFEYSTPRSFVGYLVSEQLV